jgi:putative FmdB family regulatory protein
MPLFEFKCSDCGQFCEMLILGDSDIPVCRSCGSSRLVKQVSAHSSMSGPSGTRLPGPSDTACCGSAPGQASGCAGPGSCCGKKF